MPAYVVQQGDCITSIAGTYGFHWQTLWDANPDLKAKRVNPNALLPGDIVQIPDKDLRIETRPTDAHHKFVLKGEQPKLKVVLERYNRPLANQNYTLTVEGATFSGTTDERGYLEAPIEPTAKTGKLSVPDCHIQCTFNLGYIDPFDEIGGAQGRLQNLGFLIGDATGVIDQPTTDAIMLFQSTYGLEATGELDDATQNKLKEQHDFLHAPLPQPPAPAAPESPDDDEPEEPLQFEESQDAIVYASDHQQPEEEEEPAS
jgi:hypothetical protein